MLRISAKKRNHNCTNCSEKWVQNIFVNISEISPLFYFQLSKSFRIFFYPSISGRTFEIMSMMVSRRSQIHGYYLSVSWVTEVFSRTPRGCRDHGSGSLMWTNWDLDIFSKPFRNALSIILDEPACFLAHPIFEFWEKPLRNFETK